MLQEAVGGYDTEADCLSDVELLNVIASLPSLDPFLMRERLRHLDLDPSRVYFDLAEADIEGMRAFVGGELSQLVRLAFATGGQDAGNLSQRMADKLMTDQSAKALDTLRETLRLSGEEYVEGVFAWKGFLYYKWMMEAFRPQLQTLPARFESLRIVHATIEEQRTIASMRQAILKSVELSARRVEQALLNCGAALAALTDGQPSAFRTFLVNAPSLFIPIGEAVGVMRHIQSFWDFRFSSGQPLKMDAEEAAEVFYEFEATLGGREITRSSSRDALKGGQDVGLHVSA